MRRIILGGDDIVSHLIIENLVKSRPGDEFLLHFDISRLGANRSADLRRFYRLERGVLGRRLRERVDLPSYLSGANVKFFSGSDLNEKRVVDSLTDGCGEFSVVSVRCYQKLSPLTLAGLSRCGPVLNLHPGRLPKYRGVLTFAHAMIAGDKMLGWTLHDMNADWDAGPIRAVLEVPADYGSSVLANMINSSAHAASLVLKHWESPGVSLVQDESGAEYFTHLNAEQIEILHSTGVSLCRLEEVRDAYCALGLRLGRGDLEGISS